MLLRFSVLLCVGELKLELEVKKRDTKLMDLQAQLEDACAENREVESRAHSGGA